MPGTPKIARHPPAARPSGAARAAIGRKLVLVDQKPIQAAAWAEYHTARKRLEKTTRDLHRHETVDVPAYESWLHRTFPIFVTTLRELHADVAIKTRKVQEVLAQAAYSGGSLKRLWRQQKEREAKPEPPEDDDAFEFGDDPSSNGSRHEARREDFERASGPPPSRDAREIYRRLVQRLHPDRGGDWTAKREQLWHEVQRAWAAADTDWLSRLEVDWESANEVLSEKSPPSRLRRAIEEIHAARRDTERKLAAYRASPQWRFTKNEKHREALHRRTENNFTHDLSFLQRQLQHLNSTIASWEEDWTRSDSRLKSRRRRSRTY